MDTLQSTPSSASTQTRTNAVTRFYRPELDVLRFLAFLMVFFHHEMQTATGPSLKGHILIAIRDAGGFGVCLFFILSSYLITELLLREHSTTGDIHIPSFYVRRILRIWPLYFFMLFVGFGFGYIKPDMAFSKNRLLAFLLLAGNWDATRYGYTINFIAPLWSISVEEQFYLLWPTIARFGRRSGILIVSIIFWLAAYVALFLLCHWAKSVSVGIWMNSFVQFQYFALGAVLSLVLNGNAPRWSSAIRLLLLVGGGAVLFLTDFLFHVKNPNAVLNAGQMIPGYFLGGIGCVLLFLGVLGARISPRFQPLIYLGKISYGLYVFHELALYAVRGGFERVDEKLLHGWTLAPIALALTIGLAALSYRYLELPFLKLKERFTFVKSRGI